MTRARTVAFSSCDRVDAAMDAGEAVERLVTSPGEEDASRRECRNRCEVNATEAVESLKNALDGRGGFESVTVPVKRTATKTDGPGMPRRGGGRWRDKVNLEK